MNVPVGITARHMELTPATYVAIQDHVARLGRFHNKLRRCDVVVVGPSRHHRHGGSYAVHIDLRVPGADLVVNRRVGPDLDSVIHQAFDAARRRLQDQLQRRRGHVKRHAPADVGMAG